MKQTINNLKQALKDIGVKECTWQRSKPDSFVKRIIKVGK